jgi:hypothetical protein
MTVRLEENGSERERSEASPSALGKLGRQKEGRRTASLMSFKLSENMGLCLVPNAFRPGLTSGGVPGGVLSAVEKPVRLLGESVSEVPARGRSADRRPASNDLWTLIVGR